MSCNHSMILDKKIRIAFVIIDRGQLNWNFQSIKVPEMYCIDGLRSTSEMPGNISDRINSGMIDKPPQPLRNVRCLGYYYLWSPDNHWHSHARCRSWEYVRPSADDLGAKHLLSQRMARTLDLNFSHILWRYAAYATDTPGFLCPLRRYTSLGRCRMQRNG